MRRWKKISRQGSSFVSVVIGVLFMLAIGVTILTVATKYLTSVYVDRNSSNIFYQSEGILEEVRTGLLEKAGEASKNAYVTELENYTSERKSIKTSFTQKYFNGIIQTIGGNTYNWNDESQLGQPYFCDINKLKKMSKVPDAVKTKAGTALAYVINKTAAGSYTLTLKNLFIDYTEPDTNYRSTVGSDIVFAVPDYQFEGNSTFDVLKDYISISDHSLVVDTPVDVTKKVNVTGNVYAGKSIQVKGQNNADFHCNTIISREDMETYTGSTVNVTGETEEAGDLWLRNIRLKPFGDNSTLSTKFSINANSYISNDLYIEDNNSVVTLKGKYYGFSYNKENDTSVGNIESDYSSAILVNGVNTTINASDLDKMVLSGRAFVAQKDEHGIASKSNIMLGESVSVKSNQLAYLVPDHYMPEDHNPVVISDVTEEFEQSLKTRLLGSVSPLKEYLNASEPFTANYNPDNYVFFFLNFASEQKANQYFLDCYTDRITEQDEEGQTISSNEKLKENAKSYLLSTDMTNNRFSGNLYLIAGNAVYNYASSGNSGIQQANYYDSSGKPMDELIADGKKIAMQYLGNCLTLQSSGSEGRTKIRMNQEYDSTKRENNMVADGIISMSDLNNVGSQKSFYHDGTGATIVVAPSGDYTIDSSMKGLIIAKGNVTVEADFTGLILAGGTVSVKRNCQLKSDIIMIGNLLDVIDKDETLKEVKSLFTALNGKSKPTETQIEKCVSYQNWEKNEY